MKSHRLAIRVCLAAVLGSLEVAAVRAADCNGNGTPDNLDPDCNSNGLPDACDISGKLYWVDSGSPDRIQRANFSGTRTETLVSTGLLSPRGIAVDVAGGQFYWTDFGLDVIQRANLGGSGAVGLITTGLVSPRGIALDLDGGKMYWCEAGTTPRKVQRANLDGSGIEDLITTGLNAPFGIALDVDGGKMYFTDSSTATPRILRANLNGSTVETLVSIGLESPFYIALDLTAGKMYWTDNAWPRVSRANLDGSSLDHIVTGAAVLSPTGIAVDSMAGKVYWSDTGVGFDVIQRANLDGTAAEDVSQVLLGDPQGLALAFPVADADTNGVPDECEVGPTLLSAATGKPNASGSGGFCDIAIDMAPGAPVTSEPRNGGITELIFTYDAAAPAGVVVVESDCTCPAPPTYAPIDPNMDCLPEGDTLVCTFSPALPNACTYRLTVPSGAGTASVELRGLIGDVNHNGAVNGNDRSVVIGAWTGPGGFSCETDINSSGSTNGNDRSIVIGAWTGAGTNCAP